jgi:uncharacterized protein YjiS (DUF1127 family)
MELVMTPEDTPEDIPEDEEFDFLLRNARNLTPEQRDRLVRRAIVRAKAYRAQAFRDLFDRLVNWIKRRVAVARLQRLDDRMLKDIGITRGEIEAAVRGHDRPRSRPSPKARGPAPACGARQSTPRRSIESIGRAA